LAKK
jgi:hypothetical protein